MKHDVHHLQMEGEKKFDMSLLRTSEDMKGQNIPTLTIYLFYISATLWGFTEQEEVTGLFSEDCILPCSFPWGDDVVIHWSKGGKTVHSYYHQKDQPADSSEYINRTQLFHENITSGNASLKICNLTVTDEGTYECYVGTKKTHTTWNVTLRVKVSSYYALEYEKTDTERKLKCYAFLTYPAPNISWVQGNVSIQEIDREETRDGVLYSLRSDQNIINTGADPYYCHIHVHRLNWIAEWKMQDQLSNTEGSDTIIPCECSSNTANTEGVCVVWKLNRNSVTSVVASFNGTSHSYQPRAQINRSDFSLILHHLTAADSGEYLCNISTPHYTKVIVTTLQVEMQKDRNPVSTIRYQKKNASLRTGAIEIVDEQSSFTFPFQLQQEGHMEM
ncbi:HERV-H LTR-associating protein 2 isoform X3 [Corapipo altera]|uniref:HERV-H LTR-associating protein 2 isoform X3 n=1 Tax=Corapipo altera TaxID=415028 RepID=UPI000FD6B40B|nr:HERV-H LTR-associating protein 2 isoform X3 [Corapipo altera]XP_027504407.1 HERV-H LTR-associating protein 2 isoform X3 [Corapipo altera]